jgi:hypothetical protein
VWHRPPSREQLREAIKSYDALARIQDPARAGQRGDPDALRRWPDDSLQQVKPRTSELRRWRALLDSPPTDLDVEESLTRELPRVRIGSALEGT